MYFNAYAYGDHPEKHVTITTDDIGILRDIAAYLDERISLAAQHKNYKLLLESTENRIDIGKAIADMEGVRTGD